MADYIKLYHFSGKFFGLLLNQFVILPGLFGKYRGQGALVLGQKHPGKITNQSICNPQKNPDKWESLL